MNKQNYILVIPMKGMKIHIKHLKPDLPLNSPPSEPMINFNSHKHDRMFFESSQAILQLKKKIRKVKIHDRLGIASREIVVLLDRGPIERIERDEGSTESIVKTRYFREWRTSGYVTWCVL